VTVLGVAKPRRSHVGVTKTEYVLPGDTFLRSGFGIQRRDRVRSRWHRIGGPVVTPTSVEVAEKPRPSEIANLGVRFDGRNREFTKS
jgi:hypothetical protein